MRNPASRPSVGTMGPEHRERFVMREFHMAFDALRSNKLRFILTVSIIAVGITSIVGIQTAIDVLSQQIGGAFGKMGADTFTLRSSPPAEDEVRTCEVRITQEQAARFAEAYGSADVSICAVVTQSAEVSFQGRKSDPTVKVAATDCNRLRAEHLTVAEGRNLSPSDMGRALSVCLIGDNLGRKLFGDTSPIGMCITACGSRYTVVGRLERQGTLLSSGADGSLIIPYTTAARCSGAEAADFEITVLPRAGRDEAAAEAEAVMLLRNIRRLPVAAPTDFETVRSDAMRSTFESVSSKLSTAALIIGLITLISGIAGLMNTMLVSVRERTREIGLRKAVGAPTSSIRRQFLEEAVLIGEAGGVVGIILGTIAGNIVSMAMEGPFTIPWKWVAAAVVLSLAVSIISGSLPAVRAARLNPVEALRHE